jgi:hypothetical protein
LYRDNPHVELVRVRRPDRDERRAFFMRAFESLHGAREVSGRRDELCGALSDLTDGSMLWASALARKDRGLLARRGPRAGVAAARRGGVGLMCR